MTAPTPGCTELGGSGYRRPGGRHPVLLRALRLGRPRSPARSTAATPRSAWTDEPVAGAGPLFGEGQPTAWSTYIATDDADAIAARVEAAGGKVLVPAVRRDGPGPDGRVPRPGRRAVQRLAARHDARRRGVRRARRADLERAEHPRRGGLGGVLRLGVRLGVPGQRDGRTAVHRVGAGRQTRSPACSRWTARLARRPAATLDGLFRGRRTATVAAELRACAGRPGGSGRRPRCRSAATRCSRTRRAARSPSSPSYRLTSGALVRPCRRTGTTSGPCSPSITWTRTR